MAAERVKIRGGGGGSEGLKLWKSDSAPKFETCLGEFISILHAERLRYELSANPR